MASYVGRLGITRHERRITKRNGPTPFNAGPLSRAILTCTPIRLNPVGQAPSWPEKSYLSPLGVTSMVLAWAFKTWLTVPFMVSKVARPRVINSSNSVTDISDKGLFVFLSPS